MISTTIPPKVATICTRALLLSFLTFYLPSLTPASAQTAGQISIGGKVYGGGKEGAILTGNTTNPAAADAKDVTLAVTNFTADAAQASQVTINSADDSKVQITAVFGGGEQGRAYGKTNVTVNGGTIGVAGMADSNPNKPVNGNAFGAGDGQGADVFGGTHVLITAGTINGSVYGGGNQADLVGSTELTLQGGKYVGAVFGGAKQADIWGHTFVNVDGANAKNDLHIIDVYGGNDIAGNIRPTENTNWSWAQQANLSIPSAFTLPSTGHLNKYPSGNVTSEWNAFVYASKGTTYKTLIDNIYGGGNGDYGETDADGVYTTGAYAGQNLKKPVIDRTYLQIEGGMYGSLYGGGNAATVAKSTDICLVNGTEASETYIASLAEPSKSRFSSTYQFNRVFGGNNKEPMAIRPNWYLEKGTINNLYSGGNAGPMTYFKQTSTGGAQSLAGDAGILVHVKSNDMTINNVYGGCRMADVDPNGHKGADMTLNAETIDGYDFPRGYAARVLIEGGNINNVYGGNDVSGNVYYGSLVEIHSSINGNVYGAGNGSYAYTDNAALKDDPEYGDYYYEASGTGLASAQALSIHRPNAAQSYVHVTGTSTKPTYIGGAIYCGGNSATLRALGDGATALKNAKSELHIGSYVIADNVFLGSNGENMVTEDMLKIYANQATGYPANYSSMDLTNSAQFEEYMRGVEVAIKPVVTFDAGYVSHSTKFGSLYCGGNVGSMSADGYFNVDFLQKLVIYNKLVGGCNNANVAKSDYNAYHMGGLTGAPDANNNKVLLTVAGLLLEPRVLTGNVKEGFNLNSWNKAPIVGADPAADMLIGGNIYGGCYSSGYINGGVNIDIKQNAISPNVFAAAPTGSGVTYDEIRDDVLASTLSTYGGGYGKETEIWGNVTVSITDNGQIMKAYGGGEMGVVGKLDRDADGNYLTVDTLEWYPTTKDSTFCDTTIVVSGYAAKPHKVAQFAENSTYNTTVNLNANLLANDTLNVAKLYAGGFQGTVSGNTTLNLNRGRAYDAFGGASNADILGHAETYIGKASAPTITHNVYGANDFGGLIVGQKLFLVDNTNNEMEKIVAQTYVEYYAGKIGDGTNDGKVGNLEGGNIFGGPCGAYDYADARYAGVIKHYTVTEYNAANSTSLTEEQFNKLPEALRTKPGFCKPMLLKDMLTKDMLKEHSGAGYGANSFVNIISPSTSANDYIEGAIFGAGQGKKGRINSADERGSYVRLASATTEQRTAKDLSPRVYGAGYCSNTNRSLVDAYAGRFGTIFGAAHGITYEEVLGIIAQDGTYETNYMGYRSAVRLHQMVNRQMDIYGGGANAGAQESGVELIGGQAKDVYGASYDQGITYAATVDVPAGSTSRVNTIFGGARGKSDEFPCDVFNTFVTWRSANARVNTAIYGGNNNARMTRNAYISINQPVKNYEDKLTDVFGGGFGENTVTLYTEVGLHDGAQVANAYGGGNNGKVLDTPSFRYYLDDGKLPLLDKDAAVSASNPLKPSDDGCKTYPTQLLGEGYGYQKYLRDTEVIGFHSWIMANYWTCGRKDSRKQPLGSYEANDHGHAHDLYFLSTQMDNVKNTHVIIEKGATVAENVYGGGYGAKATVSGETHVQLLGGTVVGDIYGGGYGGHVEEYPYLIYPSGGQHELTMSATNVDLGGGSARNVYGGGLNGNVTGATYVTLGTKDQGLNNYYGTVTDSVRDSKIKYGQLAIFYHDTLFAGDPIVERSLYGGGQNGHVKGTAYLTINQGHVGYKYVAPDADAYAAASESEKAAMRAAAYVENLDLNDPGDNFLDQNGNAFGAGYGEGAYVDVTYVNLYGGTIRNSLYGGGEIAAVGEATMSQTGAHPQVSSITVPGRTHIYMYNGLVQGDVFGGGRGYSYDLTGNEVIGKVLYTDGYVFGTTDVNIRGGVVGTPETVANGRGNVFGGGNIGYVFSDAHKDGPKGQSDGNGGTYTGRYYTHEWVCDDDECGFHDFCYEAPTVCGKCGKSTTATDPLFRTTFTQVNTSKQILSEDCRVVISPYAQVKPGQTITIVGNGKTLPDGTVLVTKTFKAGEYVPTAYLDLLKDKNTDKLQWDKISDAGVTVRNAVFAGGNVSSGSDKVYANAVTVFGNATASVNDIFFRDMITIGTEHIGGLYGDGNLTFVDGYRELNITNYGTDYYSQQDHITLDQYNAMNDRERAYFELEYQTASEHTDEFYSCNVPGTYTINRVDKAFIRGQHITVAEYNNLPDDQKNTTNWTHGTKTYNAEDKIKQSEWNMLSSAEQGNWEMFGFCSIYAGRLLNTIQRADFCGVFGSRLVLQGAQDRVPEVVDYTQYTINRVGELSLNKKEYEGTNTDGLSSELQNHGNYFGMYNIVNYLGALTSDVDFHSVRTTDNTESGYKDAVTVNGDTKPYGTATYYDWKVAHEGDRKRNNGTAHNTVALAAGVYLELVKEPATAIVDPDAEKDWGLITGVVQLDLINVMPGLGGGYVYAKNVHGERSGSPSAHENLSIYNYGAVNNSAYQYSNTPGHIETSGNFIHNVKQIVDDCFPRGGDVSQPAHYWYIRGEIYVYDQYISAFTGSSTAYTENINLPLTITAGANGRLDLIDIKQNYYAYYGEGTTKLGANEAIVVNNITYGLNDVITYWDYMQLNDEQKAHFVKETYVAVKDYCTSDMGTVIEKGEVILPSRFEEIKATVVYDPEDISTVQETGEKHMKPMTMADVFHVSNAVSHENGYVLAVKLDNPVDWDSWYSPESGAKKINQAEYGKPGTVQTNYLMGPTYYTNTSGVYGQHEHVLDQIVTKTVVDAYTAIPSKYITDLNADPATKQATVSTAYVAVAPAEYDYASQHKNVQVGVGISAEEYQSLDAENRAKFSQAYTCINTFEEDASSGLYIYFGELIPITKYQDFHDKLEADYVTLNPGATAEEKKKYADKEMSDHFDKAYIVTEAGYYGGQEFIKGYNYRALDTWATLSAADREKFNFRYDALDALLFSDATSTDPLKYYPATGEEGPGYSTAGGNDVALYDGPYWTGAGTDASPLHQVYGAKQPIDYTARYTGSSDLVYNDKGGTPHTIKPDSVLGREAYENLPNEKRHYSSFEVKAEDVSKTFYIVKESFISGGTNYAAGRVITEEVYNTFDSGRQAKVITYTPSTAGTYYICRESYTVNEKGGGQDVKNIVNNTTYSTGATVPSGTIISATNYASLVNKQLDVTNGVTFTIIGNSPIETSTFYVNRESDIYDLSKDRVVTLVYQYKYEESDESGNNVEEITERHIINVHITFKSGVPTIGKLQEPSIVLPGQTVGLKQPGVTPGAYELLGGGWEIFTNPEDAEKHTNGKTYVNNATPMYWYQDGYYVAYYAKTYLGKTYSNSVPFKVANYHDISEVMADTENYMFIDNPNVKRNSKIYIDTNINEKYTTKNPGSDKSEIDMLYDLFQTSLESTKKTIYVNVQDTLKIEGVLQYWELDSDGKPTSTMTTTDTGHPVPAYWDVDASGNKDESKPKTATITAFPATHQEKRIVPQFDDHVRNCANLAIYLSEDVSTTKDGGWTPIGDYENALCFMGRLHGMGYTINGLDKSLFENLCGYVYNLGVTGSFTKSGVADHVSDGTVPGTGEVVHGHVNSSWIYTSADPWSVGGTMADPILPVVGEANNLSLGVAGVHTLNCYYPEECGYYVDSRVYGPNTTANSASLRQFNNGEVAYDLNGFYLNKRYSDNAVTKDDYDNVADALAYDKAEYQFWEQNSDGSLKTTPTTGYYLGGGSMHAYNGQNLGYVERLFADGDFVYQHGTIPLVTNERYSTTESRYLPIWPDDYYFFGQQLTYGYDETERPYQPLPAHARKTISQDGAGKDNRLVTTEKSNIIYRVPAYFRSSEKHWAHINPYAVFADKMEENYTLSAADVARGLTADVLDGRDVHPGLTAIDFTGHNDFTFWTTNDPSTRKFKSGVTIDPKLVYSNGSRNISGLASYTDNIGTYPNLKNLNDGVYFGPITDYTTIMGFQTFGITQNLLTYAPTVAYSPGTAHTLGVLQGYFNEPVYADHYSGDTPDVNGHTYRTVEVLDPSSVISSIKGHLVQKENTTSGHHYYYAASDHFLVDKQDFNAPFEYEFNPAKGGSTEYRMWYQRTPDNYADMDKGWEGVSLPFAAELVTTQNKGEITHFYNSALGADYAKGKTSGHEYWLREFTGVKDSAMTDPDRTVTTALMNYPVEGSDPTKTVTNTFLWDYYYNADGKDANDDDYRHDFDNDGNNEQDLSRYYYGKARSYENYPLSVPGKPYIAGFPGGRYYEFDLSGTFVPEHSGDITPDRLDPQTITFVSNTGITIRVSDTELADANAGTITHDGYVFHGNYLNVKAPAADEMDRDYTVEEYNEKNGTSYTKDQFDALDPAVRHKDHVYFKYYVLNAEGSRFDLATTPIAVDGTGGTPIYPFRPYFTTDLASRLNAPSIAFTSVTLDKGKAEPEVEENRSGNLRIWAADGNIYVVSESDEVEHVRVSYVTGVSVASGLIQPGEMLVFPIAQRGIYLVNTTKVLISL